MPLFGSKTEVGVDLDRAEVVAGEEVRASIDVGELDKKVQGGRVELGYRNTYREDDTDSDGDRTTTTRKTDVVVVAETLALGNGRLAVALPVPRDAPGTASGSVEWFVRAVVDRKRARDATARADVVVRAPAEALATWSETRPSVSDKCAMELTASSRVVQPGDTITGTLTLTPHEAISARAIRVQLRRLRADPDNNTDESTVPVELCGERRLEAGENVTFDYTVDVPADAPPSFRAAHNEQHWYVEGVIDVKRASDPVTRLEIVVHNA
jgi:sporulation-control protein spo0M